MLCQVKFCIIGKYIIKSENRGYANYLVLKVMGKRKKILFAVLDWGLGHATRSIPLIRVLAKDYEVIVAATGRPYELLKDEFPYLQHLDVPDYGVKYSKTSWLLLPYLAVQIPGIIYKFVKEHRTIEKIVTEKKIDLVISDNRYGVYSSKVPSYFITHQLRFRFPKILRRFEIFSEYFNRFFFSKFRKVFIPDASGFPNLSGDLAHKGGIVKHDKIIYIGPVADVNSKIDREGGDVSLFVSISGPEPQRTLFEKLIMEQLKDISGNKIVVLGKPGDDIYLKTDDTEIFSHLPRKKIHEIMSKADIVISRSGYTTVMELAALGKKALFVPTPGQTEQEYLSSFYMEQGLYYSVSQSKMDLKKDLKKVYHNTQQQMEINCFDKFMVEIRESLS